MPAYRLYRLDGSGKIDSADWIEADTDAAAIADARNRVAQHRFELWRGKQLVCREGAASV